MGPAIKIVSFQRTTAKTRSSLEERARVFLATLTDDEMTLLVELIKAGRPYVADFCEERGYPRSLSKVMSL